MGRIKGNSYVLVNVVKATISGHETSNLLSVLDELHSDTLTDSGVRLLGLKTTTSKMGSAH
jgi:hypothetical protein